MRKLLLLLLTLSCTFASMFTLRGSLGGNVATEDTSNYAIHGQFMHPIPMVPNIRLEKSKDDYKDDLEAILFYNLLDETFFLSLDLGVGVNKKKISSINYDKSLPSVFVGIKTDLPFSDLSLKVRATGMQKKLDVGHKAEVMVEYKLMDNLFIDLVMDVGLRDEYFWTEGKTNKKETIFFELNFTI